MTPGLTPRKGTDFIVVHCSASRPNPDTGAAVIDRWHRQRGFTMIGYHYVIKTDGTVEPGRHPDSIGAHVEGHNAKSIGICLVGGVDAAGKSVNNFTPVQFQALTKLIAALQAKYPGVEIRGHRDFRGVKKDCPCYDVRAWAFAAGLLL